VLQGVTDAEAWAEIQARRGALYQDVGRFEVACRMPWPCASSSAPTLWRTNFTDSSTNRGPFSGFPSTQFCRERMTSGSSTGYSPAPDSASRSPSRSNRRCYSERRSTASGPKALRSRRRCALTVRTDFQRSVPPRCRPVPEGAGAGWRSSLSSREPATRVRGRG